MTTMRRTRTVDQMFDYKLGCLLGRKLRQGHGRLQEFTHIGDRQSWQSLQLQLTGQLGIPSIGLSPVIFCLGNEPGSHNGHGQMMLPSSEFLSLQFIPTDFGFSVLIGSLHKMANTFEPGQAFWGSVSGCITQGVCIALVILMPDHQPLFGQFALLDRPDTSHGKTVVQFTPLSTAHRKALEMGSRGSAQLTNFHGSVLAHPLGTGMKSSGLSARVWRDAKIRLAQVDLGILGHFSYLKDACPVYLTAKPPAAPIQIISRHGPAWSISHRRSCDVFNRPIRILVSSI